MATVVFFDTSVGTFNHGDDIIMRSVYREFEDLLRNNYRLNFATHLVNYTRLFYDRGKVNAARSAEYKFICGTDILWEQLWKQVKRKTLQLSLINMKPNIYNDSVCLGAGSKNMGTLDRRTKKIYLQCLSGKYIHSVRDEKAKQTLEQLGLKVINTGCPTLWMLTKEHCKDIPINKTSSGRAVFALTSENKKTEQDKQIIETIRKNYDKLYFWIQRWTDEKYLEQLTDTSDIEYVYSLDEYDRLLDTDIDYIGTRLHGGVFALQHKKRAIIISIDHRAAGMKNENNLPCISRSDLSGLDEMINKTFAVDIDLNTEGIKKFKEQFTGGMGNG